jgi:hypothetical protein
MGVEITLLELQTPYRLVMVIDYLNNVPTIKNRRLQHVSGNLYKDRGKQNERFRSCKVYAVYPEIKMGLYIDYLSYPDRYSPEQILERLAAIRMDTFDRLRLLVREWVEKDIYIPGAPLLLMEIFDPPLGKAARAAKARYMAKQELEKREKQAADRATESARINAANDEAVKQLLSTADNIRAGGRLYSDTILFYRNENGSEINGFNLLADIYGISLPINVRGWIAKKLFSIRIEQGAIKSYRKEGGDSATFADYLDLMIAEVIADTENAAILRWRRELYDPAKVDAAA